MFRKKEEKVIGAADKMATADRMRKAALEEDEKKFGIQTESQAILLTLIFVFAAALAFLQLGDSAMQTESMSLGTILFGAGIPKFTGEVNTDRMILVLIRGVATFLSAGIVPLLAWVVVQAMGKRRITAYTACWGVLVFLPLIYYPLRDTLGPMTRDLLNGL